MLKAQILDIVLSQVQSLVDTLPDEQKFEVNENIILFGKDASIDSLSLVSLIVDIEGVFLNDHNIELSLTDDRAMTRSVSPFNSVHTLTEYIDEVVNPA